MLRSVAAATALLPGADADLILHGGKIVTVDSRFSIAQAVVVKDGRITAVGTNASVAARERGPRTRVIELKGRTVLPGLMDGHVHAYSAGLSEFRAPLPRIRSIVELQNYVREQARAVPKGERRQSRR